MRALPAPQVQKWMWMLAVELAERIAQDEADFKRRPKNLGALRSVRVCGGMCIVLDTSKVGPEPSYQAYQVCARAGTSLRLVGAPRAGRIQLKPNLCMWAPAAVRSKVPLCLIALVAPASTPPPPPATRGCFLRAHAPRSRGRGVCPERHSPAACRLRPPAVLHYRCGQGALAAAAERSVRCPLPPHTAAAGPSPHALCAAAMGMFRRLLPDVLPCNRLALAAADFADPPAEGARAITHFFQAAAPTAAAAAPAPPAPVGDVAPATVLDGGADGGGGGGGRRQGRGVGRFNSGAQAQLLNPCGSALLTKGGGGGGAAGRRRSPSLSPAAATAAAPKPPPAGNTALSRQLHRLLGGGGGGGGAAAPVPAAGREGAATPLAAAQGGAGGLGLLPPASGALQSTMAAAAAGWQQRGLAPPVAVQPAVAAAAVEGQWGEGPAAQGAAAGIEWAERWSEDGGEEEGEEGGRSGGGGFEQGGHRVHRLVGGSVAATQGAGGDQGCGGLLEPQQREQQEGRGEEEDAEAQTQRLLDAVDVIEQRRILAQLERQRAASAGAQGGGAGASGGGGGGRRGAAGAQGGGRKGGGGGAAKDKTRQLSLTDLFSGGGQAKKRAL